MDVIAWGMIRSYQCPTQRSDATDPSHVGLRW